jgi:hypothetical protein
VREALTLFARKEVCSRLFVCERIRGTLTPPNPPMMPEIVIKVSNMNPEAVAMAIIFVGVALKPRDLHDAKRMVVQWRVVWKDLVE